MRWILRIAAGMLWWSVFGASVQETRGGQGGSTLILDETAYCRTYYRFDVQRIASRALRAEGEKVLGSVLMSRLQRDTQKRLAPMNYDWSKEDWRDHAQVDIQYNSFARKNRVFLNVGGVTAPPTAEWTQPEFDDSTWPRLRRPDGVGSPAIYTVGTTERNGWLRGVFLRFRFEMPEPAAAGAVTLGAEYVGGVRVFVNGQEVARGSLPAGELDAEAMADEYPLDAYVVPLEELSEKERARYKSWAGYTTSADEMTPVGSKLYQLRNRTVRPQVIPPSLLRRGPNALAIELRAAPLHPYVMKHWFGYRDVVDRQWEHARLSRLELRCASNDAPSSVSRPRGVQVWTEDAIRRMFSADYLEPGAAPGRIRLVGAWNGTYSAQVVVGTDRELAGVRLTASDLRGPSGGAIPARSVSIFGMRPQPMSEIGSLGEGRIVAGKMIEIGGGNSRYGNWSAPKTRELVRFAPETLGNREAEAAALARLQYFDWITAAWPEQIPANSCQPYWLSVKVPAEAAPGVYRGDVRVEGAGFPATALPLEVEVLPWRVPDPQGFHTIVAIEQSPYGVAKQYKVPLWSARHWTLVEASLRQLARAGNDLWFVPILCDTEFGNRDISLVHWIRKKDGSLAFDYSTLDRYADLIVGNCGKPFAIAFVVMHGFQGPVEVKLLDEVSGKAERLNLGPNVPDREKHWQAFARSLYSHMAAKSLEKAIYWGYPWDTDGDPALKPLLRRAVPEVFWICGSHDANVALSLDMGDLKSPFYVGSPFAAKAWEGKADTGAAAWYQIVENIQSFLIGGESPMGWKPREQVLLCTPRTDCGAIVVNGTSTPWAFRIFPERAIFTGYRGTGRMGGDYWAGSYFDGCRHSGGAPGFSIMSCLWPGPNGAESSARLEALIEGLQELEARIFVEQALERGSLAPEAAREVAEQLARHYRGTFAVGQDWQARSKAMYQLASEVAATTDRGAERRGPPGGGPRLPGEGGRLPGRGSVDAGLCAPPLGAMAPGESPLIPCLHPGRERGENEQVWPGRP